MATKIQCPICYNPVTNPVYSVSRHAACPECIYNLFATAKPGTRPLSPNTRTPMDSSYYGYIDKGRCSVCHDSVKDPVHSKSGHIACKSCIDRLFAVTDRPVSPITGALMDSSYYGPMYIDTIAVRCNMCTFNGWDMTCCQNL